MGKRTGSEYTKMPEVPEELAQRLEAVMKVLADKSTISAEARALGVTRVAMQTLVHRTLHGMIDGVTPRPPGPVPTPASEVQLREENARLRRDLRVAETKAEMAERFLSVAGDLIREGSGRNRSRASSPRTTKTAATEETRSDEEERRARLAAARVLFGEAPMTAIAATVGTSVSSLFRWRQRSHDGELLAQPRGGGSTRELCEERRAKAEALVRDSHGLIGANALRHAVPGVSRREARRIKRSTCRQMERERIAACKRVEVTTPAVIRGFDAMYVSAFEGRRYALIAGDGAIPFRTSALLVPRYDEPSVIRALERDFAVNGTPLVLRMDRAASQATPRVREMLRSNHVLLLRGPAHHPGYYGQQERQNRDHRAWLDVLGPTAEAELAVRLDQMLDVLNTRIPRRALGWQTPSALWTARRVICDNRQELEEEVGSRMRRIEEAQRRAGVGETVARDRAERFAIETALERRGYLRIG